MYSVTPACARRVYSSALEMAAAGGRLALRCSSSASDDSARASSRSISTTSSRHVYGSSATFFRYQS